MPDCREEILSEDYYDYIYSMNLLPPQDVCATGVGYGMGVYHRPASDGILYRSYYTLPKLFGLMDVSAAEEIGALRVQTLSGLRLRGAGCLIGLIDTGIQYDNPTFEDENGMTRIVGIWDQTDQSGTPPEGLGYGSAYTREDILTGREIGGDENGHGTYLASIAAGKQDLANGFTGVAPQASIAMVKLKPAKQYLRNWFLIKEDAVAFQETDIMFGVKYLQDLAENLNMPLIIMIALGSNSGPHTGSDAISQLLEFTGGRIGNAVVCAAGNEGDKRHHFFARLTQEQDSRDVEIRVGENGEVNGDGFIMELWGAPPDIYSLSLISPEGEIVPRISLGIGQDRSYDFLLSNTSVEISYRLLEFLSGNQLIFLRFRNPAPGIWKVRVSGRNLVNGAFHIWLPIEEFLGSGTYFLQSDPDTTITVPGNNTGIITLSGYDHRSGSLYIDSGRGYTADGLIKPDLCAPAVSVTGVLRDPVETEDETRYTRKSGTSIAAAFAAGVCAQMLEWGIIRGRLPSMRTVEIRNLLIRGATRRDSVAYPNNEFGYGLLNIYNTFLVLAQTMDSGE